jgi:hypothetical protein
MAVINGRMERFVWQVQFLAQNIQSRVTTSRNGHFTSFLSAMVDSEARERIRALEEWAARRDCEVAELSSRLSRGAADFARLAATVEAIRASSNPHMPAPSAPSVSTTNPPEAPSAARSSPACPSGPASTTSRPLCRRAARCTAGFASLIVADFPALFAEFRVKRFALLWCGSRDGFSARDFRSRCDSRAPTLTLIQDT